MLMNAEESLTRALVCAEVLGGVALGSRIKELRQYHCVVNFTPASHLLMLMTTS